MPPSRVSLLLYKSCSRPLGRSNHNHLSSQNLLRAIYMGKHSAAERIFWLQLPTANIADGEHNHFSLLFPLCFLLYKLALSYEIGRHSVKDIGRRDTKSPVAQGVGHNEPHFFCR